MMTDEQNKKWNIRENINVNQTTRAEAKGFTPNRMCVDKEYDKRTLKNNKHSIGDKDDKEIVEKKENGWITPKNTCQQMNR